jgi:uncharacterized protein YheU (UPF0270 family)
MNESALHQNEQGIEVPVERINPDTLRKMIEEFVTREWADLGDDGYTLDDKISQVLRQLEDHSAKVMYELSSESWNIVATKQLLAFGNNEDE